MKKFIRCLQVCCALAGATGLAEEAIIERGPHHDVHQLVNEVVSEGRTNKWTNQWTVLQSGLNYFSSEENAWRGSDRQIDIAQTGAEFKRGPFKVKFPPNPNAAPLELALPNQQVLKIQTVGIAMTDTSTGDSVWLGELRECNGVLAGSSVVYTNAFEGVKADLRVTVNVGKLESDVAIREQVLAPQVFGFSPEHTRLEIWHRVYQEPQGVTRPSLVRRSNGQAEVDEGIDFGEMFLGPGTAFLIGTNGAPVSTGDSAIPVVKARFKDEEVHANFIIESVPYLEAEDHLKTLPRPEGAMLNEESLRKKLAESRRLVNRGGRHHPVSIARSRSAQQERRRNVASISRGGGPEGPAYLLDYTIMVGASNFRFKGDTTYYVTNEVNLTSKTTIEGGTVIKFASGTTPVIQMHGSLDCQTSLYAPAIFTSKDDNSVGEIITGSSGSPGGQNGQFHLYFSSAYTNSISVHDIHSRFARYCVGFAGIASHEAYNLQFVSSFCGVAGYGNTIALRNVLSTGCNDLVLAARSNTSFSAEHLTAHHIGLLLDNDGKTNNSLSLLNSLVVIQTNSSSGLTTDHVTTLTSDVGVFQTVKAGAHYLPMGSAYYHAGGTNVSATMANILSSSTAQPPLELTNRFTIDTALFPSVERGFGIPTLGYAYPALDFIWSNLDITNAVLTLTNGVCVSGYGPGFLTLRQGGAVSSQGLPHHMNRLVTYNSVQEQPQRWITNFTAIVSDSTGVSAVNLRFTEVSAVAGSESARTLTSSAASYWSVSIVDSFLRNQYWSPGNEVDSGVYPVFTLKNNVIDRGDFNLSQGADAAVYLSFALHNNLFRYGTLYLTHWGNSFGGWEASDNLFDNTGLTLVEEDYEDPPLYGGSFQGDYNGFMSSSAALGGSHNVIGSGAIYDAGPLGNYYYATNFTSLVNVGSVTADYVGLYQYTTRKDQTKEGSTTLDIGFHYVAVDNYGVPADNDGDGISDYFEDANGSGTVNTGESAWTYPINNLGGLTVFTPFQP